MSTRGSYRLVGGEEQGRSTWWASCHVRRITSPMRPMPYNQSNPRVEIDPRTAEIMIDGDPLPALPMDDLPLNRRYFLL